MKYNWQQKDWPHFQFSLNEIEDALFINRHSKRLIKVLTSFIVSYSEQNHLIKRIHIVYMFNSI